VVVAGIMIGARFHRHLKTEVESQDPEVRVSIASITCRQTARGPTLLIPEKLASRQHHRCLHNLIYVFEPPGSPFVTRSDLTDRDRCIWPQGTIHEQIFFTYIAAQMNAQVRVFVG